MLPPQGAADRYEQRLHARLTALQGELLRTFGGLIRELERPRVDARTDARTGFLEELARLRAKALAGIDARDSARGELAKQAAKETDGRNAQEFQRVFGIRTRDVVPEEKIDTFRRRNVRLIKSVETDLLDGVDAVIKKAHDGSMRVETLRKRIQERFEVSKSKASLIARDQVLKLNAQITQDRQRAAGVEEYVWTTSNDERVRGNPAGKYPDSKSNHWKLRGTVHRWDDPPVVDESTGRRAHPGEDYQCRCIAVPRIPGIDVEPPDQTVNPEIAAGPQPRKTRRRSAS